MAKFMPFDWRCTACNHTFEEWAKPDIHSAPCPECGSAAQRLVSRPRLDVRMGLDPEGCPTAADKWARMHTQAAKIENERARDHGPDAYGSAGADVRR